MPATLRARARRWPASALAIVMPVLLVSGCAGTQDASGDIGDLRSSAGSVAITVPALWAAARKDGTFDGGIEPTEVIVSTTASAVGYTVDLSSIEAKGAGASWEAATASAAAFATLFSGVDPSRVSLNFTITGPIDGPSAGGLLTCGLLAAFSGVPFKPDVTMTGTISPDGSIGIVGYIPRKVQAAAEAGYRTVVIPAEALREGITLPDGRTIEEYAASLEVTLVPVRTVGEAYAALTGLPAFYPESPAPELAPTTTTAAAAVARAAVDRLSLQLSTSPRGSDAYALRLATSALAAAEADLATGDATAAYGQATFGAYRLARANGAAAVRDGLDGSGLAATKAALTRSADEVIALARQAVDRLRRTEPTSIESESSLPTLLSWPVFALATVEGVRDHVANTNDEAALMEMGRIIEEERLAVVNGLPDAESILDAEPASPPSGDAATVFRAYETLLDQAADANRRYAEQVLGTATTEDASFSDQGLSAAITALEELADSPSTSNPMDFAQSATDLAIAMTDFWFTSALVAATQAYGRDTAPAIDTRRAFAVEAQNAAVSGAAGTVFSVASLLASEAIQADLPNWSARWADSVATAYRGTPESTEANWLAQSELWYDVIQVVMLRAMARS